MNRISVSRLACLSAKRICQYYRNPALENKFYGLHNTVLAEGISTDKLLGMSCMSEYKGKKYYITFDEVVLREGVAYLYVRKIARKGSKPQHLAKCQMQVGLLAAFLELSAGRLTTVKRIVDHGYKRNSIDLQAYKIVYVLDYNGTEYDVMPNTVACLGWAHAKMLSLGLESNAVAFDKLPLPEVVSLEMAK